MRNVGVVVAVLAVLIVASVVGAERSANATSEGGPYDSQEVEFLHLINEYRQNNGAGALLLSDTIALAAEHHSQDMANYSFFGHISASSSHYPVGSRPWDRMRAEGYEYNTLMGENIAVGCQSAQRCFELWRNSPSHNAAMLDGDYRVIGIARLYVPGSVHGWYWTTDFGGALEPSSHAPAQSPSLQEEEKEKEEDGLGIENGGMDSREVWHQQATDDAQLILRDEGGDGYARLGDYDNGRDELSQKIRVEEKDDLLLLSYWIKIETTEGPPPVGDPPSDVLKVRLVDGRQGESVEVLKRYSDSDGGGGWRHETVELSRFGGRTLYLSFVVKTDELLTTAFYLDRIALHDNEQ